MCTSYHEVDARFSEWFETTVPPAELAENPTAAQRATYTFQNDLYKTSISNNKAQQKENRIIEDIHAKANHLWTELFEQVSPLIVGVKPDLNLRLIAHQLHAERADTLGGGLAHLLRYDFSNRRNELSPLQRDILVDYLRAKSANSPIQIFRVHYDWLTAYCTGDAGTFMEDRRHWMELTDANCTFQEFELKWDDLLTRMAESGNPISQLDRDFRIVKAVTNPHLDRWRIELENDLTAAVRTHTEASFRATCRTYLGNNPQHNQVVPQFIARAHSANRQEPTYGAG